MTELNHQLITVYGRVEEKGGATYAPVAQYTAVGYAHDRVAEMLKQDAQASAAGKMATSFDGLKRAGSRGQPGHTPPGGHSAIGNRPTQRPPEHTRVRATSIEAIKTLRANGTISRQQEALLAFLYEHSTVIDFTRKELSRDARLGWDINVVCGRVKELLDLQLIEEQPPRECQITGYPANPVRIRI